MDFFSTSPGLHIRTSVIHGQDYLDLSLINIINYIIKTKIYIF